MSVPSPTAEPRFGVLLPTPWTDADRRDARPYLDDVEAVVGEAVAGGWHGVFCAHHLLSEVPMAQPLQLLSWLAPRTGDLDLGTAILVLPLLNPIQLAEEAATLDQLSGGRLVLGVGAGYRPHEFESLGVRLAERGRRLVEYVELLRRLWTGERVSFDGEFFTLRDVRAGIAPAQRHVPVWIGAQRRPTVERALRIGDAWLAPSNSPDRSWLPRVASLPGAREKADRPLFVELHVADSREEAISGTREYLEREYSAYGRDGSPDWFVSKFESLLADAFVIGDPDHVAARLREYMSMGFNYFVCRVMWGGLPVRSALAAMRLLRTEVWTRLRVT